MPKLGRINVLKSLGVTAIDAKPRQRNSHLPQEIKFRRNNSVSPAASGTLDYFFQNVVDEEALARQILEVRWPRFKNLDSRKRFEKAVSFLGRRGFGFDVIKKTVKKLENESF